MPKAANGGYRPGAPSGTAAGQPSLWGSSSSDGGGETKSYAGPSVPKLETYTATGSGGAQPEVPGGPAPDLTLATQPRPEPTPVEKPSVADVGTFGVDLSSPAGMGAALKKDQTQANNLFDGLAGALFGDGGLLSGPAKAAGEAIGQSPLAPVAAAVGAVAGPVFDTAADIGSGPINAATGIARLGLDAVSTVAEHTPMEVLPFGAQQAGATDLEFNALPDSPEKQKVIAQIAGDPLGGGHLKSVFIKQYVEQQQRVNPSLLPEGLMPAGSLGDAVVNALGTLSTPIRPIERAFAGAAKADGLNRLQAIEAVHNGAEYAGGGKGNTEVEEFAYQQWHNGVWSSDQALTFLAASGAGFSHDPALEIAGQVALDPTVWGSLGAAGLSKIGIAGMRLAELPVGETLRVAGTASKYNILGRLAESAKVSNTVRVIGGTYYTPLQDSLFGQAAKTVRTIIDPLHAIGGHGTVNTAGVDIMSEAATRVMDGAYGELASRQVVSDMNQLGLLSKLADAKATYSANKARSLVVRQFVQGLIDKGRTADLAGHVPADFADSLTHAAPKDWADLLKQDMVSVRETNWNPNAVANLGERMASFFGQKSAAEWAQFLTGKSTDYLGHLHAATYGAATKDFLNAIGESTNILGVADAQAAKLPRLILLNKTTLTDIGARSILEDLQGAKSLDEAMAFIEDAKRKYPELGYVSIDPTNAQRGIDKFVARLGNQVEDGVLPSQLVDREIAKLPQPLQDLYGRMANAFDFGFRPEDDKLFGLGSDGEGMPAMQYDPWVDHVAVSHPGYRGIQGLRYNAAGMPIIGEPIGKVLDYIEAGAKTMTARVNTASIVETAKSRFTALMSKHAPNLPEQDARRLFDAVSEAAQLHKVTARGLSESNMWDAVERLIPDSMRFDGTLTARDFMAMIVHAYEGDLRFVGLTQKLTGRAKKLFAQAHNGNFAGQMSEDLYTKIKFKANPIFQAQERAEPWVLNSMRGANPAFGTKLTAVDRMTIQEMRNLRDSGVIRATDVDQAEFAAYSQIGDGIAAELARKDPNFWNNLTNVGGAKRVNEIRTYQTNMGQAMRDIFEQHMPGQWDKIVANYSASEGGLISDAEAATRYIAEQHAAGNVTIHSVIQPGDDVKAFQHAISSAEWYRGNSLGEIKGLNLDFMARAMSWTTRDGKKVDSIGKLRAALADQASGITNDRVADTLRSFGAHEDYIRRVTSALDFHWDGFWRTAQKKYNLSTGELTNLRNLFVDSAKVRGMTPVDYMSQVYSPMIGGGTSASIESLDSAVSALRAVKGSDAGDLGQQLADIFRHHLDPSGQQTLIEAFEKDLPAQIDATMKRGAKVTSQNLQATLSRFEGGTAASGGAVAPTGIPVTRYGEGVPDLTKPHGTYVSVDSPGVTSAHADLGPPTQYSLNAKNALDVSGGVGSAGVEAFKRLAPDSSELMSIGGIKIGAHYVESRGTALGRKALIERLTAERPGVDWARYKDSYEIVESLGAQLARDAGHDAILNVDAAMPDFSEAVALHPAALTARPASRRIVLGSDLSAVSRPWNDNTGRLWRQAISNRLEEVRGMAAKDVKATAKDPDVERAVQQYVKWSKQVLGGGFLGDDPAGKALLQQLGGIPTDAATPANHMHALMVHQVTQAQRMAGEDAFRLQYFARNRTFLERSINHPFFGIYPASYMWGKIAPEMARFMALSPFGLRTGAGLRAMQDFQVAVASQREFDPSFETNMNKVGSSAVAWFLGYMLPSLPWDVGAAAPSWMRDIAQQGLENQQRVDRGEAPKPIDLAHALTKVGDYINPLRPAGQIERPLGEIGDALNGGAPADKQKADRAAKKAADDQAGYEKDLARATVAVQTAKSRLATAKTVAAKRSAQTALDSAQRDLDGARTTLQTLFPGSSKIAAPAAPQGFAMRPGDEGAVPDQGYIDAHDPGGDLFQPTEQNRDIARHDYERAQHPQGSTFGHALAQAEQQATGGPIRFNPNAQLDSSQSQIDFQPGITTAGAPDLAAKHPLMAELTFRNELIGAWEDLKEILFGHNAAGL